MDILTLAVIPLLIKWGTVAIGLGLVIFFHELGHFAVAKWCDVNVERFSIGFGPILLRKKWGETEYALSAIPFGGYVKMLGQDDMDPAQLSSEQIAEDPRSYTAKGVLPRMAIISAGVIMNVITGLLFFLLAFRSGVDVRPAVVGEVRVGLPAWEAGVKTGDTITSINDRPVADFSDLMRATALSSGALRIDAVRPDRSVYSVSVVPDGSGTRRQIGIAPTLGLDVIDLPPDTGFSAVAPGSAAASASPALEPGDEIVSINGQTVQSYAELTGILADHRDQPVELGIERATGKQQPPESLSVSVPAAPFRTLGITMDLGRIYAVRDDSPAAEAQLQVGDRLAKVDGQDIGTDLDPLRLPDYFGQRHGQTVKVEVERSLPGGEKQVHTIEVVPDDRAGWSEAPSFENTPVSVPSIGIAYHMVPTILSVEEGGPASQAGIQRGETITRLELTRLPGSPPDGIQDETLGIDIEETNWAFAFWQLQTFPARAVKLTVEEIGSNKKRTVEITPQAADDWYLPTTRGIRLFPLSQTRQAETIPAAFAMAWDSTRNSIMDIYLTLQSLVAQRLSVKELHGPLGILDVASQVVEAGLIPFLMFLGFLSINLAVLNFLPIPLLDGGHMVFLLWEAATRRKPPEAVVVAASYAGLLFVLGLMVTVLWVDIQRMWFSG